MITDNLQATIKWYDDHASDYAAKVRTKAQLIELEQFSNYLPKDAKVLDVGCAAGRDSHILKELGFQMTGVDISPELIKIAKKEHSDIKFIEANFLDLPFKNRTFEGIWASASLVHLETKEQVKEALQEFKRVLTDDGILYLCVQSRLGQKSGWVKDAHSQEGRFFQFLNLAEIEKLVQDCDLEIVKSFVRESSRPEISWSVVYARKLV